MAYKKFRFGMLVMVLVFGMAVIGCDHDSGWHEPTNVRTTVLQNGRIHITWDRVPDARGYATAFRRNIDSADTRTTIWSNITDTTHTFTPPPRTNDITSVEVFVRAWRWVDNIIEFTGWVSGGTISLP